MQLIDKLSFQKMLSSPSCQFCSIKWKISNLQLMELFTFLNIGKITQIQLHYGCHKPPCWPSEMEMVLLLTVKVPMMEEVSCGGSEISSKEKVSAADHIWCCLNFLEILICLECMSLTVHGSILSSMILKKSICTISKSTLMSSDNYLFKNSSGEWLQNPMANMVIFP